MTPAFIHVLPPRGALITIFIDLGVFLAFLDNYKYKNINKITRILENVVRCKYFEAGVHIKNPIKKSYQDGLGRTTQTLDHIVMVHILTGKKGLKLTNIVILTYVVYSNLIHPCSLRYSIRSKRALKTKVHFRTNRFRHNLNDILKVCIPNSPCFSSHGEARSGPHWTLRSLKKQVILKI